VGDYVPEKESHFVPELKIIPGKHFETFLKKSGSGCPKAILWITIGSSIYLRESGVRDEKYLHEVTKHEHYHFFNKLPYAKCHSAVEGFIELMKYADIMKDDKISDGLKSRMSIAAGYREYAAQQYLVLQIIGKDHLIVGQMVLGEAHLRERFDLLSKPGEYDRIFGGSGRADFSDIFAKSKEKGTEKSYDGKLMQIFDMVFTMPLGDVKACSDVEKRLLVLLKNAEKDCPGYPASRGLMISEICTIILAIKTRGEVGHIGMVNSIRRKELGSTVPEGMAV
jgi:hypothetical protein